MLEGRLARLLMRPARFCKPRQKRSPFGPRLIVTTCQARTAALKEATEPQGRLSSSANRAINIRSESSGNILVPITHSASPTTFLKT